jgi:hypothetical protein
MYISRHYDLFALIFEKLLFLGNWSGGIWNNILSARFVLFAGKKM